MSQILPIKTDGQQYFPEEFNNAISVINNTIVQIASNDGTLLQPGNSDALTQGFNIIANARQNSFNVSGTANTIILTTNAKYSLLVFKKYTDNFLGSFRSIATNTSAAVMSIDGLASLSIRKTDDSELVAGEIVAGNIYSFLIDNTNNKVIILNPTPITALFKNYLPYSANSAKTTNGYADFIDIVSNTEVSFDLSVPLVTTFPDGETIVITSHPNIDGLNATDGTYKVIMEKGQNAIATLSAVTESYVVPTAPVNGDYWLDLSVSPYIPKKYNGASWDMVQFVKLAFLPKVAGIMGTPICCALNGFAQTQPQSTANGTKTFNHNIGTTLVQNDLLIRCINPVSRFQVGDIVQNLSVDDGAYITSLVFEQKSNGLDVAVTFFGGGIAIQGLGYIGTVNFELFTRSKRLF